jgi:hypothetical protein
MKLANATNLNRKSGGAQWRDLLFLSFHPIYPLLIKVTALPFCHPDPDFLPRCAGHGRVCGFP